MDVIDQVAVIKYYVILVVQLSPCRWYTSKSPYMSWNCRGHVVCGWQGAAQVDIHRVPVLSYTLFAVGR